MASCTQCGVPIGDAARFCPRCGASQELEIEEHARRVARERTRFRRAVAAFQWVFVLPLLGSLGLALWRLWGDLTEGASYTLHTLMLVVSGSLGSWCLRPGGWAAGLPWRTSAIWYLAALPVAGGMLAAGLGWVELVSALSDLPELQVESSVPLLLTVLVVAPLLEEWLCRGVLWEACRRITSVRGSVLVTATLFAFLHGLNGGFVLELPHRFAAGLLLGWLRLRSGSLLPGVLAHFANNLVAVLLW